MKELVKIIKELRKELKQVYSDLENQKKETKKQSDTMLYWFERYNEIVKKLNDSKNE